MVSRREDHRYLRRYRSDQSFDRGTSSFGLFGSGVALMMKYHIHKAVVIGSGTMGAAIAAHLANIGVPVTLLDIVAKDSSDKNKIVKEGWDRCIKAKPANLMADELKTLVTL